MITIIIIRAVWSVLQNSNTQRRAVFKPPGLLPRCRSYKLNIIIYSDAIIIIIIVIIIKDQYQLKIDLSGTRPRARALCVLISGPIVSYKTHHDTYAAGRNVNPSSSPPHILLLYIQYNLEIHFQTPLSYNTERAPPSRVCLLKSYNIALS